MSAHEEEGLAGPTTTVIYRDTAYEMPGHVVDLSSAVQSLQQVHSLPQGWQQLRRHLRYDGQLVSLDTIGTRVVQPEPHATREMDMFTNELMLLALGINSRGKTRGGCIVKRRGDHMLITCTCLEKGVHHMSHILEVDAQGQFVRGRYNTFDRWKDMSAEDAYGLAKADVLRAVGMPWDSIE